MPATTPNTTRASRTYRSLAACLGFALVAFTALPAAAEVRLPASGDAEVEGNVVKQLAIGSLTTSSDGERARTSLRLNEVEHSRARDGITNTIEIGDLTLRAQGRGAVSETVIGTVEGVEAEGAITNSVTIGSSLNIAIGGGARACTEIGTMGPSTCR